MFSPFSFALEELDGSLQNVHAQIEFLGAALEVNDDQLIDSLADARQHAVRLRDMLRAERPNAHWVDRRALGQLVHELEMEIVGKARRNQQRRDQLLELADQLDAGSVKHRFDTRSAALNMLRLEAVRELRSEAGAAENVKELPGPVAGAWLAWACGLQEARDAAAIAELRLNFPNLERFAGEMEEGYWAPSPAHDDTPTRAVSSANNAQRAYALEVYRDDEPASPCDDHDQASEQGQSQPAEFYKVSQTASYDLSLSPSYTGGPASAVSELNSLDAQEAASHEPAPTASAANDEVLLAAIASAAHVKLCEMCGGTFPTQFKICPFDGSDLRPIAEPAQPAPAATAGKRKVPRKSLAPAGLASASGAQVPKTQPKATDSPVDNDSSQTAEPSNTDDVQEPAEVEFERLKTILQQNSVDEEFQLMDTAIPRRKLVIGLGAVAAIVLLSAVLGLAYRSSGGSVSRLRSTVLAASADVAGIGPTSVPDSEIQRGIEQKLALLKGSTIQANVDKGVVTLVGQSSSEWEALHAESLASQMVGVKRVKNEVEVDADVSNAGTKKSHGKTKSEAAAKPMLAEGK